MWGVHTGAPSSSVLDLKICLVVDQQLGDLAQSRSHRHAGQRPVQARRTEASRSHRNVGQRPVQAHRHAATCGAMYTQQSCSGEFPTPSCRLKPQSTRRERPQRAQ